MRQHHQCIGIAFHITINILLATELFWAWIIVTSSVVRVSKDEVHSEFSTIPWRLEESLSIGLEPLPFSFTIATKIDAIIIDVRHFMSKDGLTIIIQNITGNKVDQGIFYSYKSVGSYAIIMEPLANWTEEFT